MSTLNLSDIERLKNHPDTKSALIQYEYNVLGLEESYSSFVERINSEIDNIIQKLEAASNYYQTACEDSLTYYICSCLQQRSINAEHGSYSNGETDLKVSYGSYKWIAEAKWFRQYENAYEGMRQLVTRYISGRGSSNHGAVILYNKTSNSAEKIKTLQNNYSEMGAEFKNIQVTAVVPGSFEFTTTHTHSSGENIVVRHRLVLLHHNPEDKSGRKSKIDEK